MGRKHRNGNAHPERLQHGSHADEVSKAHGKAAQGRRQKGGEGNAHEDGYKRCNENVHFGFPGNRLADFRGKNGDEQDGQRSAGAAQRV